jgi:phage antirepressor YoqD-like protein
MNELKLLGLQKIGDMEFYGVEGGFGDNNRCILARDIANIHGVDLRTINQDINRNIKRFKLNIDIIDMKNSITFSDSLLTMGYNRQSIANSSNIYLLSERGYAKLLKILDDDTAWEQYDILVDNYFKMRKELQVVSDEKQLLFNIVWADTDEEKAMALSIYRDYKNKQLAEKNKEIDELKPYKDKYGVFIDSEGTYSFEEAAKMFSTRSSNEGSNIKVTKISLPKMLREREILCKDKIKSSYKNFPRSGYEDYFNTTSVHVNNGEGFETTQTRIKGIGLDYIYDLIIKEKSLPTEAN